MSEPTGKLTRSDKRLADLKLSGEISSLPLLSEYIFDPSKKAKIYVPKTYLLKRKAIIGEGDFAFAGIKMRFPDNQVVLSGTKGKEAEERKAHQAAEDAFRNTVAGLWLEKDDLPLARGQVCFAHKETVSACFIVIGDGVSTAVVRLGANIMWRMEVNGSIGARLRHRFDIITQLWSNAKTGERKDQLLKQKDALIAIMSTSQVDCVQVDPSTGILAAPIAANVMLTLRDAGSVGRAPPPARKPKQPKADGGAPKKKGKKSVEQRIKDARRQLERLEGRKNE